MSDYGRRKTPPENEEEHAYLWDSADKAQKAWRITGPVYAVVSNWKAGVAVIAFVVWLNSPEVVPALKALLGVAK